MIRPRLLFVLSVLVLLLSVTLPAQASRFGQLVVTVQTIDGDPLPGASVRVEGTRLGAAADVDGHARLLAVPPANHVVIVSAIGYQTKRVVDVGVVSGRRTPLEVALKPEAVEMEPVTVTFQRPPVELDATSERVTVLQETIAELPVRRADHMLAYQPGVIVGPGGDLHMRGGQGGDMVYVVDGLQIEDPIAGRRGANIGREGMQEVQFLSGTFDAEYGSSMDGVVNIVSREGGERLAGSVEWESPAIEPSPWRDEANLGYEPDGVLDEQDPLIPAEGRFSGTLRGPLGGTPLTFFLHGVHEAETKPEPFGDKWVRRITGKLAYPMDNAKLAASFGFRGRDDQPFDASTWDEPEHAPRRWERNNRVGLSWTHTLRENFFYDLSGGWYHRTYDVGLYRELDEYPVTWQGGADGSGRYASSTSTSWIGAGKVYWQPDDHQEVKAGIDLRTEELEALDGRMHFFAEDGRPLWSDLTFFDENPLELGLFAQNRVTLGRWLVNGGLRFDYVDLRGDGWEGPDGEILNPDPATQLSPRLGVAYRVSPGISVHAGYGRFFKMPDYELLFISDVEGVNSSTRFLGNPELDAERTTAYELGLKQVLSERWGYALTGYYKDIRDLIVEERSGAFVSYRNADEARAYGVELSVHRILSDYWSLDVNYTLGWAESEPRVQEFDNDQRLPWDRRHSGNVVLAWQAGQSMYPELWGSSLLRGVSFGALATASSGLPFGTKFVTSVEEGRTQVLSYRHTDPFVRIDVRLAKTFEWDGVRVTPFTTVDNLLDRRNVLDPNAGYSPRSGLNGGVNLDVNPELYDIPRLWRVGVTVAF